MNTMLRIVLITLSALSLVATAIWWYTDDGWEPIAAFITSLAALIGLIVMTPNESNKPSKITMKQKGGDKSKNYQAGGDMTIND